MSHDSAAGTRDVLTKEEAEARSARVSGCSYDIQLSLTRGAAAYRGDVTLRFHAAGEGDLFIDFRRGRIEQLELNGSTFDPGENPYRLALPARLLREENVLRVVYENDYDHEGDGLHQFIDPQDGEEYVYTNFEPFDAHRVFPSFDQPDIKATYTLTVTAPAEWEVVTNSRETAAEATSDGRTLHRYATTKPFSTYLVCMVAGPYAAFREEHRGLPIGLFCRKSMARFLDTEEVFTITRQGLDFFGEFFDFPYPFDKYDQIFVPEFNAGAMENVGCVTHNEFMIHREPPTDNQRRRRAEVILHEMAHMWFGDLVTMKWWNDIWLNESFATYMAYLAMAEATRFDTGWLDFNAGEKNWGYRQDQLVTTHPIAGLVRDTDETFLNFDGITYAKGASVLKQLVASIGMEGFREGMRHYFRTYAWGNTTLAQFLGALETGSGHQLGEWSKLWLETASLNTIAAEWETDGERLTSLALVQTAPPEYPTLRPHYLEVGLVREGERGFDVTVLPARISGERADVPGAQGLPKPLLVFPNYNDHAWAKVQLDPESLAFVRERIDEVEDTLLRQMLWSSLANMVRDAQLPSTDYLALVRAKIPAEPNISLLDAVLAQASTALSRYVPDERRDQEAALMFAVARDALARAATVDARIIWARNLVGTTTVPENVLFCARLADGEEQIEGVTIDQEMRWTIVQKFAGYNLPGARERIAAEAERDPSDRGQRARITAETSFPDPDVKAAAWERIHGEGYGSAHLTFAAMGGFNWWKQAAILAPYVDRFFAGVIDVFRTRDKEYAAEYHRFLFPTYRVQQDTIDRAEAVLRQTDESLPHLQRLLRESNDELARAIRCRALVR